MTMHCPPPPASLTGPSTVDQATGVTPVRLLFEHMAVARQRQAFVSTSWAGEAQVGESQCPTGSSLHPGLGPAVKNDLVKYR